MKRWQRVLSIGVGAILVASSATGAAAFLREVRSQQRAEVIKLQSDMRKQEARMQLLEERLFAEEDVCLQLPRHPQRIVDDLNIEYQRIEQIIEKDAITCKPPKEPVEVLDGHTAIVYNERTQESGLAILLNEQGHAIVPAHVVTDQQGTYSTQRAVLITTTTEILQEEEGGGVQTRIDRVRDIEQVLATDWSTGIALIRFEQQQDLRQKTETLCFAVNDLNERSKYPLFSRGIAGEPPQIARQNGKPLLQNTSSDAIGYGLAVGHYRGKTENDAYPDTSTSEISTETQLQSYPTILLTPQGRIAALEVGRDAESGKVYMATAADMQMLLSLYQERLAQEKVRQMIQKN